MKAESVPGNQITLLQNGEEYFPALLAAMAAAQQQVWLETYIFANDAAGKIIASGLRQAAERGLEVRVVVDGFGSPNFMADFGAMLSEAGAEVQIYRQEFARFRFRRYRLRRLHRKLACIDGCIAFVGGINIIDDYDTPRQLPPRHDFAVRVEGPLLAPIHHAMQHMQNLLRWASLGRRIPSSAPELPVSLERKGRMAAAFLIRDNIFHRHDIEDAYLLAFAQAKKEILVASAYFLPGRRFRQALIKAAQRGVKVTVILQGRMEYVLIRFASQALYGTLLDHGVRIVEYQRSFLHAKVATVDDDWATVGSSNIDPFSLLLAREANVVVRDVGFTAELRGKLESMMQDGAREIPLRFWHETPWLSRLLHWAAYGLVRWLLSLSGYGRAH